MTTKEMVKMRLDGATYREIAKVNGTSYQNVYNIVRKHKDKVACVRGKGFNIENIIYKGIYEYFQKDEYECISSFTQKIYNYADSRYCEKVRNLITGEQEVRLPIKTVMKICDVVGKPFEETFTRR